MKNESKFWQEVKKNLKDISCTRLESWASLGVPDVLCYNKNSTFFTIELKVTKVKKLRFSPHQISFHMRHPDNTFILAKTLGQRAVKLYGGWQAQTLVDVNHELVHPLADSWPKINETFSRL